VVRGCSAARNTGRRTGSRRMHGATGRPVAGPRRASRPAATTHGAGSAVWCEVPHVVRACSAARNTEPRTGSRRSHGADGRPRGGPAPRLQAGGGHAPCRVRRLVRRCVRGARLLRCTERGTSHGITTDAPCGREARGGPAPRLPIDGGHARCRVRHPVRGSERGARLQRCTERGTSHRLVTLARCRVRRPVRGSVRGARLPHRTGHGTSHGTATDAPCGREARGGPAPRLPTVPTARPQRDTRCPGPPAGPATVVDTPWPP